MAIARALVTGNPVLLADEPMGELNFQTGIQILTLLEAQAAAGKTVLVVTHNREISRIADRVVELSSGRITAVSLVENEVSIIGIHDNPMRSLSYVDCTQAPFIGLDEVANALILVPAPGIELEEIRCVLFAQPGVAAVQPVADLVSAFDAPLEILSSFLRVIQGVVILLAFLIAYNATSINMDDRIREIATIVAFGLRPRTALWMQMGENLLLGLMGTAVGLALGWPLLQRFMIARMETQYENIGLVIALAPATLLLIVLLSAGVMALTPLVNYRRLQRINIPNTLRVME